MGKESSVEEILEKIKFDMELNYNGFILVIIFLLLSIIFAYFFLAFRYLGLISLSIITFVLSLIIMISEIKQKNEILFSLDILIKLIRNVNNKFECPLCKSHNFSWKADRDYLILTCMNCGYKWYLPAREVKEN